VRCAAFWDGNIQVGTTIECTLPAQPPSWESIVLLAATCVGALILTVGVALYVCAQKKNRKQEGRQQWQQAHMPAGDTCTTWMLCCCRGDSEQDRERRLLQKVTDSMEGGFFHNQSSTGGGGEGEGLVARTYPKSKRNRLPSSFLRFEEEGGVRLTEAVTTSHSDCPSAVNSHGEFTSHVLRWYAQRALDGQDRRSSPSSSPEEEEDGGGSGGVNVNTAGPTVPCTETTAAAAAPTTAAATLNLPVFLNSNEEEGMHHHDLKRNPRFGNLHAKTLLRNMLLPEMMQNGKCHPPATPAPTIAYQVLACPCPNPNPNSKKHEP
jgi:hypothetical protein